MDIDRRGHSRHYVTLLCHIGCGRRLSKQVAGIIRNISRGGILMLWEETLPLPEPGTDLLLEINLPENQEFGARVMRCNTQVLRVMKPGPRPMVALKIVRVRFAAGGPAPHLFTMPATRFVN